MINVTNQKEVKPPIAAIQAKIRHGTESIWSSITFCHNCLLPLIIYYYHVIIFIQFISLTRHLQLPSQHLPDVLSWPVISLKTLFREYADGHYLSNKKYLGDFIAKAAQPGLKCCELL